MGPYWSATTCGFVVDHLGQPDVVMVADETLDLEDAPRRWVRNGNTLGSARRIGIPHVVSPA